MFFDGQSRRKTPPVLKAELQCTEDKARISERDVIDASIGVLIVSKRFLELMDKEFYQEACPVALIICHKKRNSFYRVYS